MPGSEPFEAWLDRALPAAVQSELGPSPRAWQATYRRPPTADPAGSMAAILIRGVALGAAVSVAVGGAAAALTTSGTVDLGTWEQALIAVVQGCPDAWHGQDRCGGPAGTPPGGQPRNDRPSDPGGPQVGAPVPVGTGRSPTSGPGRQPPSGGPLASPTAGAPGVPSPSPSPSPSPTSSHGGPGGRGGHGPSPSPGGGGHRPQGSPPPAGSPSSAPSPSDSPTPGSLPTASPTPVPSPHPTPIPRPSPPTDQSPDERAAL